MPSIQPCIAEVEQSPGQESSEEYARCSDVCKALQACRGLFTQPLKEGLAAVQGGSHAGAEEVPGGQYFAYALVRPPGHHAKRCAFGDFCYFNLAAVAAHFLIRYATVAVLDIDFYHGNGPKGGSY